MSVTGTGVSDRLYVWDGWSLLAETSTNGSAARRYTYAPEGVDFPLAVRQNGASYYLHQDGQGNVYAMTNNSGTKVTEYRYRAYGDRYVTPVGESQQSMLTYKGREEDRATGLAYMRNRYYSPRLERFLNEDPIGIGGGLNTFAFGAGDPVNSADPFGLCGHPGEDPCDGGTLPDIPVTAVQDPYWWLRNWTTRAPLSGWLLPLGPYAVSLGMGPNGISESGSGNGRGGESLLGMIYGAVKKAADGAESQPDNPTFGQCMSNARADLVGGAGAALTAGGAGASWVLNKIGWDYMMRGWRLEQPAFGPADFLYGLDLESTGHIVAKFGRWAGLGAKVAGAFTVGYTAAAGTACASYSGYY